MVFGLYDFGEPDRDKNKNPKHLLLRRRIFRDSVVLIPLYHIIIANKFTNG